MTRKQHTITYLTAALLFAGVTLTLGATLQAKQVAPPTVTPASVQQTMDLLIDPSADALWDSVGTEENALGTHPHAPHTDAAWLKTAGYARSLIAGAKRLQTPKLPVGANGHSKLADADTPGTRTAVQIRADIDANPTRFRDAAIRLENAAQQALTAAQHHDAPGVLAAGAALDAACESCHAAYWYPRTAPQRLPSPAEFATKTNPD